jgi:hypothetical protein
MVLTSDNHFSATWSGSGHFSADRIGHCESAPADLCTGNSCEGWSAAECENGYSQFNPICNPETGSCSFSDSTFCGDAGCNQDTGFCNEFAENDLDCNGGCPFAMCFENTSYYGNPDCQNDRCFYSDEEECAYGCDESTGFCIEIIEDEPDNNDQSPIPSLDCDGGCAWAVCQDSTSHYGNPNCENGRCFYSEEEYCANGCNDSTGYCYTLDSGGGSDPGIDELLFVLLAGGGVIVVGGGVVGGSILGLRALRRRQMIKARQLISQQPQPLQTTPLEKSLEKTGNRIDNLLKKLNTMERAHMQHGLDHSSKMMESYHRSAAAAENAEFLTKGVKWIADSGADIIGLAPGAGRYFKWAYHAGTTLIEKGIEKGVGTGIYEAAGKTVTNIGGDLLGDIVPTPNIKNIPRFSGKTGVRAALKKTGVRTIGKNYAKGDVLGKILTKVNDGTAKILFGK